MTTIIVYGMDISKQVFHVVGLDEQRKVKEKKKLKRSQVLSWFAKQENCTISMEACASSHYWGRNLEALGHRVQLLPAQHVKAFVQGNKNDYNDALAIAEATGRPKIHPVPLKTVEQQDLQAIQRMREQAVTSRTALCNQTRGLLGEYGLTVSKGVAQLRKAIPEILEEGDNGLTSFFRQLLNQRYAQLLQLDEDIKFYTAQLTEQAKSNAVIQRLQSIPGFGPLVASAFHVYIADGQHYKNGRAVSASLGLVPRQHSTGGKTVLLGISKRGNQELRTLLLHGARAVIRVADKKEDRLSRWVCQLVKRQGFHKATAALANKMARIGWAVTVKSTDYTAQPF